MWNAKGASGGASLLSFLILSLLRPCVLFLLSLHVTSLSFGRGLGILLFLLHMIGTWLKRLIELSVQRRGELCGCCWAPPIRQERGQSCGPAPKIRPASRPGFKVVRSRHDLLSAWVFRQSWIQIKVGMLPGNLCGRSHRCLSADFLEAKYYQEIFYDLGLPLCGVWALPMKSMRPKILCFKLWRGTSCSSELRGMENCYVVPLDCCSSSSWDLHCSI